VELPEEVYDDLRRYIDHTRPKLDHPDLFVTLAGEPLSYWSAVAMGKQLRGLAVRALRDGPGVSAQDEDEPRSNPLRSLERFTWHRLRHTRAREVLPQYVDPNNRTADDTLAYCARFGWTNPRSAEPYIWDLMQRWGSERQLRAMATIGERFQPRRASS
jgi:hypothetical protein